MATTSRLGLSEAKMRLLVVIEERGGVTPKFLRWKCGGTPTNISMHLTWLADNGFIDHDRFGKYRVYFLVDKGTNAMKSIRAELRRLDEKRVKTLSEAELKYKGIIDKERRDMNGTTEP
jgi:DNA-binding MarR family transcriptional regulator